MLSLFQRPEASDSPVASTSPPLPVRRPRSWQRRILRHRRMLLAGLGFIITLLTFSQFHPAGPQTAMAVVASHDLAPGTVLTSGDLTVRQVSADAITPDMVTKVSMAVHHPVVAALFGGEIVRQRDVLDPQLIDRIGPGMVALPVHVAPASAAVVQRGDHVDVLAGIADGAQSSSGMVASDVVVLIPSLAGATSSVLGASTGSSGADVVVIARPSQAAAIASANVQTTLVLALRGSSG